jgi:aldose 1-epimerase
MKKNNFGTTKKGQSVELYTLENANGMVAKITNYGGIITELIVPTKDGDKVDVVLGFDNLDSYLEEHPYFGCLVGRVAGRISKGKFSLEGKDYSLAINNDSNHLHGGLEGYDKKVWAAEDVSADGTDILKLTLQSPDGEEGYPGTLNITVHYTLNNNNELIIEYKANTDKATPICLTNHSYFNLAGSGTALDHHIKIDADFITDCDEEFTLNDRKDSLDNHSADFRASAILRDKIDGLAYQHGSHYWLNHSSDTAAVVSVPEKNRTMTVVSDAPCMQFYTGKFMDGTLKAKDGGVYNSFDGICFECQDYPNGANATDFFTNILKPEDTYTQKTLYRFDF